MIMPQGLPSSITRSTRPLYPYSHAEGMLEISRVVEGTLVTDTSG